MRGEVGGQEQESSHGWEQGRELGHRCRWLRRAGLASSRGRVSHGDDARIEDGLILEVRPPSDEKLGELLGGVGSSHDRRGEARPQGMAALPKRRERSCGGSDEGVVDCGAESSPQIVCFLLRRARDWVRRCQGKDSYELGLCVRREMEVSRCWRS